jgi:F-type H+-transporting ATPase subunit b
MAETAHTASTAASGGGESKFPPFNSETFPSQLVWLIIAFVLLYALMAKWVLPRVGAVIDRRQKHISGDIAEAERLKAESDAAAAAYEKALADARGRATAIANETHAKAASEAAAARHKIEEQLAAKMAEAEQAIATAKRSAMANVRGVATDAAGAIVERLIGTAPSGKAVDEAVADVLKGR